jgi:PAS domain S-box-containing protein
VNLESIYSIANSKFLDERGLLNLILECTSTAITVLTPGGEIIYANKCAETVLGISLENITERTYNSPQWKASALDGSPWKEEDQPFSVVMRTGEPVSDVRHAIENEEGIKKYLSINGAPIKDENGKISLLVFLVTDISENVLKEKTLIQNEFKYRNLVEQTLSLVYDLDLDSGSIHWEGAIQELTGFTSEEFNKVDFDVWANLIHPEDRLKVISDFNNTIQTKQKRFFSEYRLKHKSGKYRSFEDNGILIYDDHFKPTKLLGAMIDRTEKKQAEQSLIIAEERLRIALEAAKMGTWIWEISEDRIEWSEATYEIFDLTPSSLQLRINQYMEYIHPDYRDYFRNIIDEVLKKEEVNDFALEHKIITHEKKEKWVLGHGKVYKNKDGKPMQLIGTVTDITERKRQEEAIRLSEERFQAFYHFTSEAIIITEQGKRTIQDVNSAFLYLFGYSSDEWKNLRIDDLASRFSTKSVRDLYELRKSNGKIEMEGIKKDGTLFPILVSTSHYRIGDRNYIAYSVVDISSVKEIEMLKNINNEILIKNQLIHQQKIELESTISNLKKTQAQLIQSEKMAALGQLVAGIAHEINNPIAAIKASNLNIEEWHSKYSEVFLKVQKKLNLLNEKEQSLFLEFIDYASKSEEYFSGQESRRKRKELTFFLIKTGFTESQAEFLADAFIEIGIAYVPEKYLEILKYDEYNYFIEYISLENLFYRNIKTINLAINKASKIVYALKNFTRIDSSTEKKPVDLIQNIEIVLTIYHNQIRKGIEVIKEYGQIPLIYAYSDDLIHVWTNLIYNALQAMEYQGKLILRAYAQNSLAIVEIEDTGNGIPSDIQHKIFDPFFTTKAPGEGSGIGLDIVKKIIEKHKGLIEFQSQTGKTVFKVSLPMS